MKIKVTTVEEIDIEVTFPCYRKNVTYIYKILNEKEAVCVRIGSNPSIEQPNHEIPWIMGFAPEEATAKEFTTAFETVVRELRKKYKGE